MHTNTGYTAIIKTLLSFLYNILNSFFFLEFVARFDWCVEHLLFSAKSSSCFIFTLWTDEMSRNHIKLIKTWCKFSEIKYDQKESICTHKEGRSQIRVSKFSIENLAVTSCTCLLTTQRTRQKRDWVFSSWCWFSAQGHHEICALDKTVSKHMDRWNLQIKTTNLELYLWFSYFESEPTLIYKAN